MKFSIAIGCLVAATLVGSNDAFAFAPTTTTTIKSSSNTALHMSGVTRNPNFAKLQGGYLFPEIGRRRTKYLEENPEMADKIISLGIGDTTQPIPDHILDGLVTGASKLGSKDGYSGYGAEQGMGVLREKIATKLYNGLIQADEVFVSDGAKCDIMRLQQMFGPGVTSAVQDPSYPVYVDTSVMMGQTGEINTDTSQYNNIVYMKCSPENGFFPDYESLPRADVVYLCSPNNPTGAAATKDQLEGLIKLCKERGSILVFDAAYAPFIRTPGVPKSVFECEGAREVAIEVNSFSKYAGFTGVRLGWTVIPNDLAFSDGSLVKNDFNRVMTTAFNGASNIVQNGGMACLDDEGLAEIDKLIEYYLENAKLLRETMESIGYEVYGGTDAPYVFVKLPEKLGGSWDAFSMILETAQVVTIPGAGFGPGGEGFLRLSAFAPREGVIEACERLKKALG
uniref:Aminotransferase class I/classII large domain-containing protein n=1 Tax=Grammatophora oceanica TaxID=210454 RepID=A0A7S1UWR5_9STRA|mmetsp:Transcript_27470/g.40353  ORF Transcript_27470/g.40353 Transcript_27470/m.40353 type:complete len:452 (+) Transcript_27470:92-1447(+)